MRVNKKKNKTDMFFFCFFLFPFFQFCFYVTTTTITTKIGVVDGVLHVGHLRQHCRPDNVGTEWDGAQQASNADAQVLGVERSSSRDGQLHSDALAALHAQQMGSDALLLRRPRFLARLWTRIRSRRAGHGRRTLVRSHQTFRLSNGNRISIRHTHTHMQRHRAKPILSDCYYSALNIY